MKVIFCRWGSICENGITNALNRLGCDTIYFDRKAVSFDYDTDYLKELAEIIQQNRDAVCVFSINFHPIIARGCKVFKLPYISWTVDCPSFMLYSETISYPTNKIFLLDRMQYEKFAPANPENIFHMPLGCDIDTWDSIKVTPEEHSCYDCDISFIGSLYSEKCRYNQVVDDLPPEMKGYVDGLIDAQLNVYGYNFIEDSISDEWANNFKKYVAWNPLGDDYTEDVKGIVADTYIGYKCTEQERIRTFSAIGEHFSMDLWTLSDTSPIKNTYKCDGFSKPTRRKKGVCVRGGADSNNMMPQIIKSSKINLNLTNKPIKTGLPLRIFDLMGAGGFVISNYQLEIPELFVPDEDIVLYDSIPELLNKIDYYLSHEDERIQIAKNGYEKVKQYYTYDIRLMQMFNICGLL